MKTPLARLNRVVPVVGSGLGSVMALNTVLRGFGSTQEPSTQQDTPTPSTGSQNPSSGAGDDDLLTTLTNLL